MPEYIDREVLLKKIFPLGVLADLRYTINAKAVKYAIDTTPKADVEEVVRCKDCGYYNLKGQFCMGLPTEPAVHRAPDDYCSRAHRITTESERI